MRDGGQPERHLLTPLVIVAIAAVLLGVFFRFYHIDRKVYSGDEVYTSLRMLGDFETDVLRHADRLHDAHDLWLILHPAVADGATSPLDTVRALEVEEPHHPPFYYVLGHVWLGVFGNSIAAIRSLSAVLSLLALPLAFWLGSELYGSQRAGWISLALFALSPVGILYAQEAREYALWAVVILAMNIAVLRAIRLNRRADWLVVGLLTALGLYVYPLTLLVIAGLLAYLLLTHAQHRSVLLSGTVALAAGTLAFVPWLIVLWRHIAVVTRSFEAVLDERLSVPQIARAFAGLLRLNIVDLNLVRSSKAGNILTALAVALLFGAIVYIVRREPRRIWLLLLCGIIATTLPLLLADVFRGGQSVRIPRYFLPVYLYLDYCLAGLILGCIAARTAVSRGFGYALLATLLVARAGSSAVASQSTTWWNKMEDTSMPVARVVNEAPRPLLVSDNILDYALVLANYLRPDVAIVLHPKCYECFEEPAPSVNPTILPPGRFTDVFVLGPSPELAATVQAAVAKRGEHRLAYHCINARHNCVSNLNVEPVFGQQGQPPNRSHT